MSLRTRILLLVLLATLTPAALFGLHLFQDRQAEIARTTRDLNVLAAYAGENLRDKVRGTVQLLHGLSRARDLDTADRKACSDFLAEVLKRFPQYTGLLTIRPDGHLFCDSLRSGRELDLNDRSYFRQARDSKEPAYEVVFGRITGSAVLQVAFPAQDGRGDVGFVLLASLNLAQFSKDFVTASRYPDMQLSIWDNKGTLMARFPDDGPKKLAGTAQPDSALYRFVQSDRNTDSAELPGPDGVHKIWVASALGLPDNSGLRIALGIPRERLHAKADEDLKQALISLALVTLLAIGAALLFAELGIRRHAKRIISATRRFTAGEQDVRIGAPYPHGELGELMATLDQTANSMQAQQLQIGQAADELRRSNRTLRMLSAINSTIVRVHEREELLTQACRIAAEEGQFPIVWAGLLDRESMSIRPVAWRGVDEAYVLSIPRTTTDIHSPVGSIVAGKRALIVNDLAADAKFATQQAALALGSRSAVVLPLTVSGEVVGLFALHAREAGFFDAQEMKLLNELADDISFALDYIGQSERLDYLAYYDALTGLANRGLFLERLAQHMRVAAGGGHQLALFLIDLERFRNVNDSLGRAAGDSLLQLVAQWLTRRWHDAAVLSRVNGDQFAVVLPTVRPGGDLVRLVEKTLAAFLQHPFQLNDAVFRISAKVGVALYPEHGVDAETLLRNAETALKRARTGGDRFLFYAESMAAHSAGKLTMENQLRLALERSEFVLHYQPKVHLQSGKLTGAEALIRWNDPNSGLVPPGRFIPILEETGLIHEVGRWALRQAQADYLRWHAAGRPAVRIAVNLSPLQLRHRGFVQEIEQIVGTDPQAAAGLELEITESLIMDDVKHNIASLLAIRALGVTIAIDDFGTGFSSLSYLAKLPVDLLKIDRSFIVDMMGGPQGLALVSTIINLAHSLKLKVVAEGVETEEQQRLLRLLGCDEMQGYLYSKPVPADVFEARFLARSAAVSKLAYAGA
jgi:diguanylate cyclase (GGDEF)-like protein